nr:EGF domain containing protein [Haemonchus contortus]
MSIHIALVCLVISTLVTGHEGSEQLVKSARSLEVQLVDTREILRARLRECTKDWDSEDTTRNALSVDDYWNLAHHVARRWRPESVDCLRDLQPLLQKYKRLLLAVENQKVHDEETKAGLNAFLSSGQIQELQHMHEYGDSDAVEEALDQYFEGLPSTRRNALMNEFLDYKPRRVAREVRNAVIPDDYEEEVLDPEELKPEWLAWQTPRHKNLISKMIIGKANKWEVMNEIGDQFYHLRKEIRDQYKPRLQEYCIKNVKNVIGEENFNVIRGMYLDTDPIEQLETKFNQLVAELPEERERLLADHYAVFCRKIFRLVPFEPTDLTIWLTSAQKKALGQMIQNPNVNDTQIYDKMYEFYTNTTGEQKDEARDIIESGCRHFIAHMFGDDNAEELEELRLASTVSRQHLAARLAVLASEVSNEVDRKRAEGSLSICSRIYLAYDGSCECHGHASSCDPLRHQCLNCTDNTYGVQCELCMESFTGNPLEGGCTSIEGEETSCTCNNHSEHCDSDGKCQSCLHNTTGDSCERCAPGFYGDATTGTRDDCSLCPCPDGGDCFINGQNLVECAKCPVGKQGITCEEDITAQKEETTTKHPEKEEKKEEKQESASKAKEKAEEKPSVEGQQEIDSSTVNSTLSDSSVTEGVTEEKS